MLWVVLAPIRAEEAVQMCFLAYCVGPLVMHEHQGNTSIITLNIESPCDVQIKAVCETVYLTWSSLDWNVFMMCLYIWWRLLVCGTCWSRGYGQVDLELKCRVRQSVMKPETVILSPCYYSTLWLLRGKTPWASQSATFHWTQDTPEYRSESGYITRLFYPAWRYAVSILMEHMSS
jgi:hypothetical protein